MDEVRVTVPWQPVPSQHGMGASPGEIIEQAAEIGIEHNLGLTLRSNRQGWSRRRA